ncbi:hypothetical protein H6F96_21065 [Microcoleus sp. FACHB-53]|nr:hypothetical protein [Microcoleus sp. FACHB-53]MBD2129363.1 hypothetical protein [Microcoleus sp. FACHB-1]
MATCAITGLSYLEIKTLIQSLNSLHWETDYAEFCRILGLSEGTSYSLNKYAQFEELCKALNNFNIPTLLKLIEAGAIADQQPKGASFWG